MPHALIVDDDIDTAATLKVLVAGEKFTVAVAHTLRDARRQVALQMPDILLLDLHLPDGSGMELCGDAQLVANAEVVLITGHASLDSSIQALRLGAADYLVKPINFLQLKGILSRVTRPAVLQAEVAELAAEVADGGRFGNLWGRSEAMLRVYDQISRVAQTSVSVFISGESGTGKELVAQSVHALSRRRGQPFLAINCGAIAANLIESEIFGHEKGSFTGAERQHQGFFERANGGTLFLDEITEMPLPLQVKLLRVLETGRYMRVGSTQSQEADVRIIAATNRSAEQAVAQGLLREDLFYRLNVFPIVLPPLRDRLSDVELIAEHFLSQIGAREGTRKTLSDEAQRQLAIHHWPGNVRELRNALQRGYVMAAGSVIDIGDLPGAGAAVARVRAPVGTTGSALRAVISRDFDQAAPERPVEHDADNVVLRIGTSFAQAERILMLATLRHFNYRKERTAAALGISLKTLYNRLKECAADLNEADSDASSSGD